ncbi:cell division protein SepF [Staphylococcus durrellii]|uniref:cell division protein SepF n=1 Tax=Staphylococcus durrellii TaxID=2781773 RepID=UPI00189CCD49|nr:cell division protein SepF [Staphylococcus durrellii]MBF7017348.1 cell division protein SepF [Staphylococcus durrellii]
MALKDLFNGFFVVEEEEEEVEPSQQNRQQAQSQTNYNNQTNYNDQANYDNTENQRSIQSVPKKQSTRNNQSNERRYQLNNAPKNNTRNVVNMNQEQDTFNTMQESSKMCLFEPRVFSDTQDIADELKNRRATLVNLQRIDKVSAKRIIDFLSGTVYAIGGDIQRVGSDIFLCTPDNVEVAGSITDQIENMEQGE